MSDSNTPITGTSRLSSDELKAMLDQLHAATEHFSNARKHLEGALDCSGYDCPNPDVAEEELRAAHRELEAISAKVHAMLNKPQIRA